MGKYEGKHINLFSAKATTNISWVDLFNLHQNTCTCIEKFQSHFLGLVDHIAGAYFWSLWYEGCF